MEQIVSIDKRAEATHTAKLRYGAIEGGNAYLEQMPLEQKVFMVYHTTTSGTNYFVVGIDRDDRNSDDIGSLLERACQDIAALVGDSENTDDYMYTIMGAVPLDELDPDLEKYGEYTSLDLGYVIPGEIDSARWIGIDWRQIVR